MKNTSTKPATHSFATEASRASNKNFRFSAQANHTIKTKIKQAKKSKAS